MSTSYSDTITYLYNLLPAYQKDGRKAYKPGLERMRRICEVLEVPYDKQLYIHVAGTNGKGSVCHMLSSVLQASGYKVGLYTSPHVVDLTERFKINGQSIEKNAIVALVAKWKAKIEMLKPSFFELTVAMSLYFFSEASTDINVIEVGLGGRLDSTNIITPLLSVITNIDLEHTDILGDTIAKIAVEKGGIIKPSVPVVLGEMYSEAKEVLARIACESNAELFLASDFVSLHEIDKNDQTRWVRIYEKNEATWDLEMRTLASYQLENAQTAIAAIRTLIDKYNYQISQDALQLGLSDFQRATHFLGRFQVLSKQPLVIADALHNPAGVRSAFSQWDQKGSRLHLVLGFSGDKDVMSMIKFFPSGSIYYFCVADNPRAMSIAEIRAKVGDVIEEAYYIGSPHEALGRAKANAESNDVICIGGSIFLLGDILMK